MFPDGAGAASAAAVLNQAAGDGGSAAAAVALAGGKPHDGGPGFPATKKVRRQQWTRAPCTPPDGPLRASSA